MKNKKLQKMIGIFILILLSFSNVSYAATQTESKPSGIKYEATQEKDYTRGYVLTFFGTLMDEIPTSYQYIQLNFKNIEKGSMLEDSMKKFVYLDRFPNESVDLRLNEVISVLEYYTLAKSLLKLDLTIDKEELGNRTTNKDDLIFIRNAYFSIGELKEDDTYYNYIEIGDSKVLGDKSLVFEDIMELLLTYHYNKDEINKEDLLYSALKGLAAGANDEHTAYFPPLESQSFEDNLNSEYEGIGAYVEMSSPGVVKITSPVAGGPAEKAGLKGGDIIIKADGKEVTEKNSLVEVTSWIKGPEGTKVTLTINRDGETFDVEVERQHIVIKNIETDELYPNIYYIKINDFYRGVADEFKDALEHMKGKNFKKVIIDLRNNGGGYLDEVVNMLNYLIDEGKQTALIKQITTEESYTSHGPKLVDLNNYEVVILQNSGTASASEIMIGTLLDYYDHIVTIGENTYGKGSAQTMMSYTDGSTFKFTFAKWFTGGTETGIDGIGIAPKIELELDIEGYNMGRDNQLEAAINK